MAAEGGAPPGPSWNEGPPPGGGRQHQRRIDGSNTGPTLPAYMDPEGNCGELRILRIQGAPDAGNDNRPKNLPEKPFLVRKSIERWVNGRINGAFPEGGGRSYALKVRNEKQAERLLEMTALSDGTPVQVILHPALNTCRCVVSCRSVIGEKEEELLAELKDQGVRATEVRRIKRRENGRLINTPTLIVTVEGTCCPAEIDFGYVRCQTRPYYPNPMQCFNCWAFGHTRMRCRSPKAICGRCSGEHTIAEDRSCPNPIYCEPCQSGEHSIGSRSCPMYRREDSIQRIKVDRGLTYPQARELFERENGIRSRSYAGIANAGVEEQLRGLQAQITELAEIVKRKDEEIAHLKAAAAESSQKDATIAKLQAALANRGGNIPPSVASPVLQQPSLDSILKIVEQTVAKLMRPILESNIQTQRKLAEQETSVTTEPAETESPAQSAGVSKHSRKKSRKTKKVNTSPVAETASSPAPPTASEPSPGTGSRIIVEDSSSDSSAEGSQLDNTVIDLNISSDEIVADNSPKEPTDAEPVTSEPGTPVATSTPLTRGKQPKQPPITSMDDDDQPKTPKRSYAEMSPFQPGRPTRPPTVPKIQRQRKERDS